MWAPSIMQRTHAPGMEVPFMLWRLVSESGTFKWFRACQQNNLCMIWQGNRTKIDKFTLIGDRKWIRVLFSHAMRYCAEEDALSVKCLPRIERDERIVFVLHLVSFLYVSYKHVQKFNISRACWRKLGRNYGTNFRVRFECEHLVLPSDSMAL